MNQEVFYYIDCGIAHKMIVKFGFPAEDNKAIDEDRFIINCTTYKKLGSKWQEESFGRLVGLLRSYAPHLYQLNKWHLCARNGTPTHYIENALYWYDLMLNARTDSEATSHLGSLMAHINYNAISSDKKYLITISGGTKTREEFTEWLIKRIENLQRRMVKDLYPFIKE